MCAFVFLHRYIYFIFFKMNWLQHTFLVFCSPIIRRFTHQCSTNLLNSRKRITLFTVIKDNNKQKHISNFHQFKKNTCCADEMEMFFLGFKTKIFRWLFCEKKNSKYTGIHSICWDWKKKKNTNGKIKFYRFSFLSNQDNLWAVEMFTRFVRNLIL